ncbi:hypothetical protein SISSUDRAFT_850734 [Sistotremastrum suecicum HHB10207 ss-3]|uniref:Uncharacterized protein n=1 Tax=Sistotremastrum suecicum HHB10207 ss-3 TaxID=1314776 RepID=A0A166HLD5_9AGAM|nr:hypothetical protein SISSUDRAFT_850734 [Sistotremastrum suecicum HHB10207 ss-3]
MGSPNRARWTGVLRPCASSHIRAEGRRSLIPDPRSTGFGDRVRCATTLALAREPERRVRVGVCSYLYLDLHLLPPIRPSLTLKLVLDWTEAGLDLSRLGWQGSISSLPFISIIPSIRSLRTVLFPTSHIPLQVLIFSRPHPHPSLSHPLALTTPTKAIMTPHRHLVKKPETTGV